MRRRRRFRQRRQAPPAAALDIVAYSTPEAVYEEALEPGFAATPAGEGVEFSGSFGASGDQSRAVEAGQPASVVHFAQGGDMIASSRRPARSTRAGTRTSTRASPRTRSSCIAVRKGNPEGIKSFDDLLTKDVEVITPNPFSSGGARWNIMAIYGSQLHQGKSEDEALDAVKTVLEKTIVQPGSARDALAAFTQGEGDVLLAYENEAIKAQEEGEDVDYVIPPSTILIETPIAVTKRRARVRAGLPRLHLVRRGPADLGRERLPPGQPEAGRHEDSSRSPRTSSTIDEFGGWEKVNDEFFDEATGKVAEIDAGTRSPVGVADGSVEPGNRRLHPGQASACPGSAPASAAAWSASTCR